LQKTAALGAAAAGLSISAAGPEPVVDESQEPPDDLVAQRRLGARPYPDSSPRVILIRFGGGVRRLETILDPERTYCPFIYHELFRKNGVLFPNVEIDSSPGIVTSHGEGTLYVMTGRYAHYADIERKPLSDRFIPIVPTIFEYFRKEYRVPAHQAMIINGEDRINEDFYTFSNCRPYGINYRSTVLSLFQAIPAARRTGAGSPLWRRQADSAGAHRKGKQAEGNGEEGLPLRRPADHHSGD
jgi:hypothetical protein